MYQTIYVPVDNSDHSNRAIDTAIQLGQAFESKLVGCHVYAASMHDYRFKQMEFTLPEEYLEETELERQRKIHDSLITMGLQLISESYLEPMRIRCDEAGIEFEPKMMDGKHHVEIVKDISESEYDLTVLGVLGIGRVRDSQIGSVCERVARQSDSDVLVIKRLPEKKAKTNGNGNGGNGASTAQELDTILVGVDGSPQSFGALVTAIELAERFDKKVEAISVYDPYLHYSVFKGVVDVLTDKAAKIFRFEEQNQLHEEIIDTGLAQIYQSHLEVAEKLAADRGVELTKTLLDGKAFQKVLDRIRQSEPWLLVIGRTGVHGDRDERGLGSNSDNLLRLCPCDVLITTKLVVPELDVKAEESIRWTEEAEERFQRVPDMVKGIARTAIYRLAVEQGHSVVSSDVLDDAMDRYMPKSSQQQTEKLAQALAYERARTRPTFLCRHCGVTSMESDPKQCGVCGGNSFEVITADMLDALSEIEGGLEVETTYDGRKLKWTRDAKRALKTIPDMYQRRRAKARVEKKARIQKLPTVTLAFACRVIEEETGEPLVLEPQTAAEEIAGQNGNGNGHDAEADGPERRLIARDAEQIPLLSPLDWTQDAVDRIFRVPAGFMRDRTQERIETVAREQHAATIDLALVEQGIGLGKVMMEELLLNYEAQKAEAATVDAATVDAATVDAATVEAPAEVAAPETAPVAQGSTSGETKGKCPFAAMAAEGENAKLKEAAELYLNEVGVMSELAKKRKALSDDE